MLEDFTRLVEGLFPAIDRADAKSCIQAIKRFPPAARDFYAGKLPTNLCQGDIITPVTFVITEVDGTLWQRTSPGLLLSNSCDVDNDPQVLLAECLPFRLFTQHKSVSAIRSNTFYSLMYLPDVPQVGDTVVDLARIQTIPAPLLLETLSRNETKQVSSFTTLGWYFFIAKMTVHLLRPEPPEDVRPSARAANALERIGEAISRLGSRVATTSLRKRLQ